MVPTVVLIEWSRRRFLVALLVARSILVVQMFQFGFFLVLLVSHTVFLSYIHFASVFIVSVNSYLLVSFNLNRRSISSKLGIPFFVK